MPTKQREQAAEQPVMTGREGADHLARAARIRGGVSPIYILVQRTIKAIEAEATKSGKTPPIHDSLYYDLKNAVSPLQRLLRRSGEEFDKRLLALLEGAGEQAVETYRAERRKKKVLAVDSEQATRIKRRKTKS